MMLLLPAWTATIGWTASAVAAAGEKARVDNLKWRQERTEYSRRYFGCARREAGRQAAHEKMRLGHVIESGPVMALPSGGLRRNVIECMGVLDYLRSLPDNSVDCCISSPPFYGLRDYGTGKWDGGDPECKHNGLLESQLGSGKNSQTPESQARSSRARQVNEHNICRKCGATRIDQQIGLEDTPATYIERLVSVFREVRRVLKPTGTCWIEIGDSYWGGKGQSGHGGKDFQQMRGEQGLSFSSPEAHVGGKGKTRPTDKPSDTFKAKDLMMMPSRVAIALCDDGWHLRSDIIWSRPNPMPESVTDRPTKSHSYVFLLTKSAKYWYDAHAIREQLAESTLADGRNGTGRHTQGSNGTKYTGKNTPDFPSWYRGKTFVNPVEGRNARSVWTIATESTSFSHFATFPRKLITPMILAGCPERCCAECGKPYERVTKPVREHGLAETSFPKTDGLEKSNGHKRLHQRIKAARAAGESHDNPLGGRMTLGWQPTCQCDASTVPGLLLDPFMGSGTSSLVARSLGRDYIGCDLNPEYVKIAMERLRLPFEEHHIPQPETRFDDLPLFSMEGN